MNGEIKSPTQPTYAGIGKVIQFLLPILLGILAAWGTMRYTEGVNLQRLSTLEGEVERLSRQNEQYPTRNEMKQFIDNTRETIQDIRQDVRAARNAK